MTATGNTVPCISGIAIAAKEVIAMKADRHLIMRPSQFCVVPFVRPWLTYIFNDKEHISVKYLFV